MAVSELPWQAFASSPLVMSAINFCSDILPGSPVSQPVSGGVAGISEYNQKAGDRLHRLLWPPSWQQRPLPPRVGFVYKYFHFQGMWGVGYGCYKARNLGNTRRIQGGKGCGAPVLLQAGGGGNAAPRVSLVPAEPPNPPCRPPRVCCWLRNPASGHLPPDHGHQTPDPAGVIRQPDSNKQPDGHGRRHLGLSCAVAGQEFVPSVCSATPEKPPHAPRLGAGGGSAPRASHRRCLDMAGGRQESGTRAVLLPEHTAQRPRPLSSAPGPRESGQVAATAGGRRPCHAGVARRAPKGAPLLLVLPQLPSLLFCLIVEAAFGEREQARGAARVTYRGEAGGGAVTRSGRTRNNRGSASFPRRGSFKWCAATALVPGERRDTKGCIFRGQDGLVRGEIELRGTQKSGAGSSLIGHVLK